MSNLKIICTLGPSSSSEERLYQMIMATMTMIRLNMAHGEMEEHIRVLSSLTSLERKMNVRIERILDLKGLDLRLGSFEGTLSLKRGDSFCLSAQGVSSLAKGWLPFSHPHLFSSFSIGELVRFDSGCLTGEIVDVADDHIVIQTKNCWTLRQHKGVTITSFVGPKELIVTEKDQLSFELCGQERIDWIALSFVNHVNQVKELRKELVKRGHSGIKIISKIETTQGIHHLEEILSESDGVMFARGDLGAQIDIQFLPRMQKEFFAKVRQMGILSILATQLLSSMSDRPIPNRSEVTDVFNGVLDGANGFMLSEESAIGEFPIEAIVLLRKLLEEGQIFLKERGTSFSRRLLD
ncbi:pyruvate kinase [Candidatus Similichlamydia epinepheli]|uniref:pyruvate kinase n=1 Tax=Candidatus Similichlamydia epinepheli TaxID=1903953 RepID=UPI000D3C11A4|nr:pyruvate kinase [Candidatus Similichlamydia epinepheli]